MKLSSKVQASLNRVIEKFQSGDLSPISSVMRIRLDSKAPARNWSLSNRVLAFCQAEELDCRGYRQWQEVGRHVKKGGQAVYIVRPYTVKKAREVEGKEEEYEACIGFGATPVFPASSTEGESALPSYEPVQLPPLSDIAQRLGIDVNFVPVTSERLGDCNVTGDQIRLGSQDPSVFFHELSHAIHARIVGGLKGGQQVGQETVAEFTAAVMMDFYGLKDHTGNAWRYISQYAQEPLEAITKALSTVEQVLAVLLDGDLIASGL